MKYHAKTYCYPKTNVRVVQDVKARQAYIDRGLIKPVNDNPGLVEAYKRQESRCFGTFENQLVPTLGGFGYKGVFVAANYGITGKMYRDS